MTAFDTTASRVNLPGTKIRNGNVLPFPEIRQPQSSQPLAPSQTVQGAWPTPPNPAAGEVELTWYEANLSRLGHVAGLWIAIKGKGIKASSDDLDEILDWLTQEAIADALVVLVPEDVLQAQYIIA